MKYDLSTFKQIELIKGNPTMSVTKNGLTFSQAAIQKLAKVEYVEFLINEEQKIVAVIAKDEATENSFHFFAPGKKVLSVRITNKELRNQIADSMSWNLTQTDGYKVEGTYDKELNGLFFDLSTAKSL